MANGIGKQNVDRVLGNLNREISSIANRTQAGLTAAALFVRGEAQKITPVDTGNLRSSAYTVSPGGIVQGEDSIAQQELLDRVVRSLERTVNRIVNTRGEMYSEIGFTASYAIFVHEIEKNYTVGDWKFLERALFDNHDKIIKIIEDRASIE